LRKEIRTAWLLGNSSTRDEVWRILLRPLLAVVALRYVRFRSKTDIGRT
jgi:hypothetical protein